MDRARERSIKTVHDAGGLDCGGVLGEPCHLCWGSGLEGGCSGPFNGSRCFQSPRVG